MSTANTSKAFRMTRQFLTTIWPQLSNSMKKNQSYKKRLVHQANNQCNAEHASFVNEKKVKR